MRIFQHRKRNKHTLSLCKIILSLKEAFFDNQEFFNGYQIQKLSEFYKEDGTPVLRRIRIDKDRFIEVPLINLVNYAPLCISEFSLSFNIKSRFINIKEVEKQISQIEGTGFDLFLGRDKGDNKIVSVKLSFKR